MSNRVAGNAINKGALGLEADRRRDAGAGMRAGADTVADPAVRPVVQLMERGVQVRAAVQPTVRLENTSVADAT